MSISVLLIAGIILIVATRICLFRVQRMRDQRVLGRTQPHLFWDFTNLDDREKKMLWLTFFLFVIALILLIAQGSS